MWAREEEIRDDNKSNDTTGIHGGVVFERQTAF